MARDAARTARYRFCDVTLSLSAERQAAIDAFDRLYGAFRTGDAGPSQVLCELRTDNRGRGCASVNGHRIDIAMDDPGGEYAAWLVWEAVACASATHLFLHASAVVHNGRAFVFAAPTGYGKSTLAEAMAHAGAEALNDDITPLDRATGIAEHFPKGEPTAAPDKSRRAPVAAFFVLGPQTRGGELRMAVDSWPGGETEARADLESIGAEVQERAEYIEVSFSAPRPGLVDAFASFCQARGVTILRDLGSHRPAFRGTPHVWPAPAHEAAIWLAANLFGRSERRPADLIWEVAGVLENARAFGLRPGPPDATASAVLDALE